MTEETSSQTVRRKRAATVLGWVAGGLLGFLVNYALFLRFGPSYPTIPTTFASFVVGAFLGMATADRLGERAFPIMGLVAGVVIATALVFAAWLLFR